MLNNYVLNIFMPLSHDENINNYKKHIKLPHKKIERFKLVKFDLLNKTR